MRLASLALVAVFSAVALAPLACAKQVDFGGPPPCTAATGGPDGGSGSMPPWPAASDAAPPVVSAPDAAPDAAPAVHVVDAIDQGIEILVRQAAAKAGPKGAVLEGEPLRVDLKEGDHGGFVFTMNPNSCYTIVAGGVPGMIKELELKLLAPPFFTMEVNKAKGAPAIVGRSPGVCPLMPLPVPYKVDVVATKGSGRVNVLVFSKPK